VPSLREIARDLTTPLGRNRLRTGIRYRSFFLLRRLARLHRETALRHAAVVVVIGSFGKSTTTRAVRAALGIDDAPNFWNSFSGIALNLMRSPRGSRFAVLEVGIDGPGQMATYARMLRPDVVVVTAIGSEHTRSLQTLERTRREKAAMLTGLAPEGLAVGAADDPNVRWMLGQTRARVATFGRSTDADVRLVESKIEWPRGTRLRVRLPSGESELWVKLLGRPGEDAVLAALAVATRLGLPESEVVERLAQVEPTPSRLRPEALAGGAWLLCDEFKSAIETVDVALDVLADVSAPRKQIVLGDISEPPGPQGPLYRRIGERAGAIADRLIVVGGEKNFRRLRAGALAARESCEVLLAGSASDAARLVALDLRPGDVVLVKGRDTQKLARVSLRLRGVEVGCDILFCEEKPSCSMCPARASGPRG
jgi:UDP-N-acetylmuramoyl-tripeptide--D-alanyl-D-alanine ligase